MMSSSSSLLQQQKQQQQQTKATKPNPYSNSTSQTTRRATAAVTPLSSSSSSSLSAVIPLVDKNVVDELLLVCSVIGTHDDATGAFVPVEDCLQWLQDLQRALRRDDDATRRICLLVGDWRVVETKLLPVLLASSHNSALVLTVCKILVLLTKPLSTAAQRAAVLAIPTKNKKTALPALVAAQGQLRDNALKQVQQLMHYKRILTHSTQFWQVLVSLLAAPLAQAKRRTDEEHLTLEIVLHLLRNVLAAKPVFLVHENAPSAQALHDALVQQLHQQSVLEVLCVLAADLDQPHSPNAAYNLLVMEILQHLLLPYPVQQIVAADVAAAPDAATTTNNDNNDKNNDKTTQPKPKRPHMAGTLRATLQRQRQVAQSKVSARHGNFGGSLVLEQADSNDNNNRNNNNNHKDNKETTHATTNNKITTTTWTMSTTQYAAQTLGTNTTGHVAGSTRPMATTKRAAVFVGALPVWHTTTTTTTTPTRAARNACAAIHQFARRFLQECYAAWTKSLKNEFRRDSVRLEDGDRVVYLQLQTFWSQFWRATNKQSTSPRPKKANDEALSSSSSSNNNNSSSILGPLLLTMDVFSFHLVHNAADTFTQHKQHGKLGHAVAMLKEMMLLLQILYTSPDETEQIMACGLLDRLFYGSDHLDRLPKLLAQWQPGQASHAYAADLLELVHTQIKLLERHAASCETLREAHPQAWKSRSKKQGAASQDVIFQMKRAAADFDVSAYIRKLVTPHNVGLYTHLLAHYAINGTRLNHRIVTFLLRVAQFPIVVPDNSHEKDNENALRNPIAHTGKVVTLEPLLFHVRLLWVLHVILNDAAAVRDPALQTVVQFATRTVTQFAALAADNPMLFVEAIVKHSAPHRYCEAVSHHYVSEELLMLAERDLLLQEQERLAELEEEEEEEEHDWEHNNDDDPDDTRGHARPNRFQSRRLGVSNNQVNHEDSDDEELEFDGGQVEAVSATDKTISAKNKRKAIMDDSDSEDEQADGNHESGNETSDDKSSAKKQRISEDISPLDDLSTEKEPTTLHDQAANAETMGETTDEPMPATKNEENDAPSVGNQHEAGTESDSALTNESPNGKGQVGDAPTRDDPRGNDLVDSDEE